MSIADKVLNYKRSTMRLRWAGRLCPQAARAGRGDVRARRLSGGAHAGVHVQQDGGHGGAPHARRRRHRRRRLPRHAAQHGAHTVRYQLGTFPELF